MLSQCGRESSGKCPPIASHCSATQLLHSGQRYMLDASRPCRAGPTVVTPCRFGQPLASRRLSGRYFLQRVSGRAHADLSSVDLVLSPLLTASSMPWFSPEEQRALVLSTFAGLSTTIGAVAAIIRRPDDALLALLLGTAIGVMFTLSVAEMWLHNAMEHGWLGVTCAVLLGALLYQVVQPFLPDFNHDDEKNHGDEHMNGEVGRLGELAGAALLEHAGPVHGRKGVSLRRSDSGGDSSGGGGGGSDSKMLGGGAAVASSPRKGPEALHKSSQHSLPAHRPAPIKLRSGELLRLGLLMAVTMTMHNLPEGFAVAFSAFTSFGPIMAVAIAVHNIPEGVIVAAPVYAATGSRLKAVAIATASGLSEPLGALLALLVVRPFLTEELLQYILAFVGGIMAAVCVLELWPEAKKCRADGRLVTGVMIGAVAMGWTLYVGV